MAYIQKNNPFKKISSITTGNFKKSPLSVRRPEANPNDLRETAYTQNSSFKQKTSTGEMQQEHIREFEHLSKQYRQKTEEWENEGRWSGELGWKEWDLMMNTMRDRLWELSRLVVAEEQSRHAQSYIRDIEGGGTFEFTPDFYQESQTPLFGFTPPKEKPIPPISIKKAELLPTTTEEPVLAKAGVAPEYTTPTVDEDLSKEFHHRKYKEQDGKYSMFNPAIGKWKPITKKTYKFGTKNSTYNEETGVYERWWHKGTDSRTSSIKDESILEYLKNKK